MQHLFTLSKMPLSISDWKPRGGVGAEHSQALLVTLIGRDQRVSAHNILSWKTVHGWTTPQIGPGKFPGVRGQLLLPSPRRAVRVIPEPQGTGRVGVVCGKVNSTGLGDLVLHAALHQPVGILGKTPYLPNERSRFQVHWIRTSRELHKAASALLKFLIQSLWSMTRASITSKSLRGCSNMQPALKPFG